MTESGLPGGFVQGGRAAGGVPTLLVVDDEPFILSAMERFFHYMLPDVKVRTARTGTEGLAHVATGEVDLIISDYRMPDMDGIEFLVHCSKSCPTALRVLFTAHGDPAIEHQAKARAGIAAFIPKGADPLHLLETVRRVLRVATPA